MQIEVIEQWMNINADYINTFAFSCLNLIQLYKTNL